MTLLNLSHDENLDLDLWVGQRSATFRFVLFDGVSGLQKGELHPIRTGSLIHDTTRTIKRQLSLGLGVEDMARINTITDRVNLFMVFANGVEYPLGRYMFVDSSRQVFTAGRLGAVALTDEMFLVDQPITAGIPKPKLSPVQSPNYTVIGTIGQALAAVPNIVFEIEASPFSSTESWGIGITRGSILESLALSGDYFSPWFSNDTKLHFIRSFDPATQVADFDWDEGNQVYRESVIETDDLLTAPNRFIVISNSSTNPDIPVVGVADVPISAPHSVPNRGFVVAQVIDIQLATPEQAQAAAINQAQRQTVFEQVALTTPPDPRHDSYNVIRWQGEQWLELGWGMELKEGGAMTHLLRKAYS